MAKKRGIDSILHSTELHGAITPFNSMETIPLFLFNTIITTFHSAYS